MRMWRNWSSHPLRNVNGTVTLENSLASSQTELPYDSAFPSLGVYPGETYPHKNLSTKVYSRIIHNNQKVEAPQLVKANG